MICIAAGKNEMKSVSDKSSKCSLLHGLICMTITLYSQKSVADDKERFMQVNNIRQQFIKSSLKFAKMHF